MERSGRNVAPFNLEIKFLISENVLKINTIYLALKVLRLIFIFLCYTSFYSFGQSPYYYSFNEEVGLSSQTVYDVFEDSEFNIWFGTNEGLFKWDGFELKRYQDENYSKAYSYIQESSNGLIWCQNFSGQFFIISGMLMVH